MVNKRMKPRTALQHVTNVARKNGYTVSKVHGRGKGSHSLYVIRDTNGTEVGRFGLTGHGDRELSWTMMRQLEDGLAHLFGDKWMEKR